MASFDRYECAECGEMSTGLPGANAARTGYCSPACETSDRNLA